MAHRLIKLTIIETMKRTRAPKSIRCDSSCESGNSLTITFSPNVHKMVDGRFLEQWSSVVGVDDGDHVDNVDQLQYEDNGNE